MLPLGSAISWTSKLEQVLRLLNAHAGLDDENKELQQKLAALKVESRQKEAVNQALAQEVAECRHKQQNGQLGESWAG